MSKKQEIDAGETMKKTPIIITIVILVLGAIFYFGFEREEGMQEPAAEKENMDSGKRIDTDIYKDMQIKAAYTEDGILKVFVLAKNNYLADYKAMEGNSIPEDNSMVIGYDEAMMMQEEKLFSKPGDTIKGLFGLDIIVEGVLAKTNSPLDDFHFVSASQYDEINGEAEKIFIMLNKGEPKVFYTYIKEERLKFDLDQGKLKDYSTHNVAGVRYYPVLLGKEEAEGMKVGDYVKILGENTVIVGIIEETGSALDNMILLPFTVGEEQ